VVALIILENAGSPAEAKPHFTNDLRLKFDPISSSYVDCAGKRRRDKFDFLLAGIPEV
jgi:hypothetical protein